MSNDMIKECEQNIINRCKLFHDLENMFQALSYFGMDYMRGENEQLFHEGLDKMRTAFYNTHARNVSDLFMFVGVGGEAAADYSRERFEQMFNPERRMVIMHLLDKYGKLPSSWEQKKEEQFPGMPDYEVQYKASGSLAGRKSYKHEQPN